MKYLFVITTKDFLLPNENTNQKVSSEELDRYVENYIMPQKVGVVNSILMYLIDYQQNSMKPELERYIRSADTIPFVKRIVGDFHVYTAPCISRDLVLGENELSHDYVAKIVEIAKRDMGFGNQDELYVIAHDLDLTLDGDVRFFDQSECQGRLREIPDKHVYIFQHKLGHAIYSDLISKLNADNDTLLEGCKKALMELILS